MHSKQILIFDVEGEYGHFRKFNTTTSPLTYFIPSRPAIVGLLGAILGIEREVSANKFNDGITPVAEIFAKENANIGVQILNSTKIVNGVQILSSAKKVNIAFNLLDTEKTAASFFNIKQRTQIEFELLKNPKFRIFVSLQDTNLLNELTNRITKNQSHFTPYLGLSQFTAMIEFKGLELANLLLDDDFHEVVTAINISETISNDPIKFNLSSDFKYTSDTMPIQMKRDREVTEYSEVIVETNGKSIWTKSSKVYQTNQFGNVLFL